MWGSRTFTIHRLTTVSGARKSFVSTGNAITGRLDPLDTETAIIAGGTLGKSFRLFSPSLTVDVSENDRLVDGGEQYEVKGVQRFPHAPAHTEVVLEKSVAP